MSKSIGTIEGKIRKLQSRKYDLEGELSELETAKTELTDRLGAAILSGDNSGKIEADLTQMQARQPGLSAAIGKADNDLRAMRSDLVNLRMIATRSEITGTIERVRAEMSEAADQVMRLSDDATRWDQELRGVADKALSMHLTQEHGQADHLRKLWGYEQLQGVAADLNTRRPFQTGKPIDELRN